MKMNERMIRGVQRCKKESAKTERGEGKRKWRRSSFFFPPSPKRNHSSSFPPCHHPPNKRSAFFFSFFPVPRAQAAPARCALCSASSFCSRINHADHGLRSFEAMRRPVVVAVVVGSPPLGWCSPRPLGLPDRPRLWPRQRDPGGRRGRRARQSDQAHQGKEKKREE